MFNILISIDSSQNNIFSLDDQLNLQDIAYAISSLILEKKKNAENIYNEKSNLLMEIMHNLRFNINLIAIHQPHSNCLCYIVVRTPMMGISLAQKNFDLLIPSLLSHLPKPLATQLSDSMEDLRSLGDVLKPNIEIRYSYIDITIYIYQFI